VTGFKISSNNPQDSSAKSFSEIFESLVSYTKRETLKPIRGAGRWMAFGLMGAVCLGVAVVFGALGVLRVLQTTSLGDSNSWSWLSYLVAMAVLLVVYFLAVRRIKKGSLN